MEKIYIIILNFIHHRFYRYQPSVSQQDSYRFPPIKLTPSDYPTLQHNPSTKQLFDYNLLLYSTYER